jgi:amino acid transporter
MASYVLYGFDTAGTLAEETSQPRRRAPRAILSALGAAALAGALLILCGILAVSDPGRPELGQLNGGLPFLIKDVLGSGLGAVFLADVVFAVFVCALAVHAGTVRLVFAMARDNNLPMAHALSHVPEQTQTPLLPVVLIGGLAAALLIVNIDLPHVIETLCSVAIVWVNLAYLLVTFPMLIARLRRRRRSVSPRVEVDDVTTDGGWFSMGRLGLPVNAVAVVWGLFVIVNISWPRPEIYGSDTWGRFAAPLSTLALVALGAVYYLLVQRRRGGILPEHASSKVIGPWSVVSNDEEERSGLGLGLF